MTKDYTIQKATLDDQGIIWEILQNGIISRKLAGSAQWQNGYPNPDTVLNDIQLERSFIIKKTQEIIATSVIDFNGEEAYNILNNWESQMPYATIHRLAISSKHAGQGSGKAIFQVIEDYIRSLDIKSIRIDTMNDNIPMLRLIDQFNYKYRGVVYYNGDERLAFEKLL